VAYGVLFFCVWLSIDKKLCTVGLLENLNYISSKGFQIPRRPNKIKYRRLGKKATRDVTFDPHHTSHYDVAFLV